MTRFSKCLSALMAPFIFHAEQVVPRCIDEVFEFFSRAENLQKITPPWLNFRILSVEPTPVRKGTMIRYSLRWRIFPIRWKTEIIAWKPPHRFIDLQLKGPYKLWHHEHRFIAEGNSTRIVDDVTYELPFGVLGRIVHRVKVRRDVETIFGYRKKAVEDIFGTAK